MTTKRARRGRSSERGEGMLRLVMYLVVIAILGYLGIKNVPTYFEVQNLRHDLSELARGSGVIGLTADRIKPQADKIAKNYDIPVSDVTVENYGNGGIKITLKTKKQFDFIVTNYDWQINEVYQQARY